MAIAKKLEDFLKKHRVTYQVVPHARATSAHATAQAEHVPDYLVAKVVMVKASDNPIMVVVPANYDVDLLKLEGVVGTTALRVEREGEFRDLFPDCELGAMPPFGWLYDIPTYIDLRLTECPEIMIHSGDLEEGLRIAMSDYLRLAKAEVVDIVAG